MIAGLGVWAFWIEPRRLVVRHVELRLPAWPVELDGLRVGVLADLHAGMPYMGVRAVRRAARALDVQRPDLVCLLGDYLDRRALLARSVDARAVARPLGAVRAPLGVLAVLGNHDWYAGGARISGALRDSGVTVLEDEARRVAPELWVTGVGDHRTRGADVAHALAAVPSNAAVLLLSHDPDVFPDVPARVALTLSGHTHGGQVGVPLLRRRFIPSRFGERYAGGHVEEGGRHLYVTSGVGTSGLPVRLLRPPEVVILRLRAHLSRSSTCSAVLPRREQVGSP
ncbi:MAG TPA: metallophosphoesterase [Solirubrobacteraceae bacterium]|nr:metallophosphoesterase [Solirubrobacteraceae bacterium]